MKQKLLVGMVFITLALSACSTATPIVSEWRNPAQAPGSFKRVMIAGPSGDASVQRSFEDEFVAQLATMGVEAMPSYRYVPESEAIGENSLRRVAQEARADGLLLMRPIKVEEKTNYPTIGPELSFGIFGSNAGLCTTAIDSRLRRAKVGLIMKNTIAQPVAIGVTMQANITATVP